MAGKVFIFDDDADILMMCRLVLEMKGFEVFSATNCADLLLKVRDVQPDVILMDNKIAPEGGIQATRQLKNETDTAAIPVIYFSANINVESLGQQAGADFFLQKPFDIDEMEKLVTTAIKNNQASEARN